MAQSGQQEKNDVIKVKAWKVFEVAISKPSVLEITALIIALLFLGCIISCGARSPRLTGENQARVFPYKLVTNQAASAFTNR